MKKLFLDALIALIYVCTGSWKKSLLDLKSQSAYDYDTYFTNNDAMNEAVIATYATLLHNGLWARDYYFIFDFLGHEAKPTTNVQGGFLNLAGYSFGTDEGDIGALWNSLYRMNFRANVVIDRALAWNPAASVDQQNAKQYIAEARFLRSYAYFNIVNLWGAAPLITSYDSLLNNKYPTRAPAASIWNFIESELTAAIPDLPLSYDVSTNLGRA